MDDRTYRMGLLARGVVRLWLFCALVFLPLVGIAHDDHDPTNSHEEGVPAENLDWAPPMPDPTDFDWIQLNSKEWLKGKIKIIHGDKVSFDSDKLDDLKFDWEDIIRFVSVRSHTYRFAGRHVVRGTGEMRGDIIRVRVGDDVQEFKRADFVSMVPGAGRELDYWSARIGIGFSGQGGNTQQLSLNTTVEIARETTLHQLDVLYAGNIATQQDALSANQHRVGAGITFYFTRRFFATLPSFEFFQDQFQNIAWRITPSLGVGYDIVWQKKIKWKIGAGAGYQAVKFDSVSSGSDRSNDFPLLFSTRIDIDLPKRFEWVNAYQGQVITTEMGNSNQHITSTLSFDFWGPLDFDTTFQWDWVAQPTRDAAGVLPRSSDFRISAGLALDL